MVRKIWGREVYDSLSEIVDPKHSALLLIDMQNDFCSENGHHAKYGAELSLIKSIIPNVVRVIHETRNAGARVVFIQNTLLPDGSSESPPSLHHRLKVYPDAGYTLQGTWGHRFIDELTPNRGDFVVTKNRSSAFLNTNLDLLLKCNGVKTLLVAGVATPGCVQATALHGALLDYYVVVLKDCVGAGRVEYHEAALKVMSLIHDVVTSDQIIRCWHSDED